MNISANNQINDSAARATGLDFLRRSMAGALMAAAITAMGVGLAATSLADVGEQTPNLGTPGHADATCKTEPWGFLGSQRRTLCDGPVSGDGSWKRERTIWVPAHRETTSCYGRGSRYSSMNCYGGYWIDERLVSNEAYPVRPDTVLPDEPGHLG